MNSFKKSLKLFTSFLLLFSLIPYHVDATPPPHLVINEFDQNPPGNDSYNSVDEWVELYNPTSEAVDISGWTLSTTSGTTVTVPIPEGTVIGAISFYVINRGSQWLDNTGEAIILRDDAGNEVDRSPILSDGDNDVRSWARYPNGQDQDSDTDWRFQTSTIGESNGGEPPQPDPEPEPIPEPIPLTENVTVHFIDVGQGDSIFVDTPALDMLIDGGPRGAGPEVVNYLQILGITQIDYVVATHPHADHIGGLITVLEEYTSSEIPVIIDSGNDATTLTYQDYSTSIGSRTVQIATRGTKISLDNDVEVTIINPTSPLEFDDANDNSIVLSLQVSDVTFLFMGDSEDVAEASILDAGLGQSYDVLKVGHHGSRSSTSSPFLDVVDPEVAVISVGEGNQYDHPHQETVDKLEEVSTIYRTDLHGSIEITTDGVAYDIQTQYSDFDDFALTHTLELSTGWNMVSLPVVADDMSANSILGNVGFYQLVSWSGSEYVSQSVFEPGVGYWLLVMDPVTMTVTGVPVEDLNIVHSSGWNMVGGSINSVEAAGVFPNYYQLVTWSGSGYYPSSVFDPGVGYWALVLEETTINLP